MNIIKLKCCGIKAPLTKFINMKKFCTLFSLIAMSLGTMAQSQYFYEWKGDVITVRNVSDIDSITFPLPSEVANFTTGSPTSLTGSSMMASYSLFISGVFPANTSTSEMGVCYSSVESEPSISDEKVKYGRFAEGSWEVTINDLASETRYYYRPYLQVGSMVYYGPVKSFTTLKSSTKSLWDLLESRSELSKFREIVGKAPYYRDEFLRAYTLNGADTVYYTFKDVLKGNTHMTIWTPVNDALTDEEWAKYSAMAETNGYLLQMQLLGNHMSLQSKAMSASGQEKVSLINGKNALFDYSEGMFQKAKVVESNISAYNGVMHIISAANKYKYSLYEYIKYVSDASILRDYILQRDVVGFKEGTQEECLLDENGYPIYHISAAQDNVMFNHLFFNPTDLNADDAWMNDLKMFNAPINSDDSTFVMIIPTDAAWQNAVEKLQSKYNYVSTYPRMDMVNMAATKARATSIYGARHSYTTGKGYETVDSLQSVNISMDIVRPLVFNLNMQPQVAGQAWSLKEFMDKAGYEQCEYLVTTAGDTIRDIYEDGALLWSKSSLFENCEIQDVSNGYALIANEWNFPHQYWMRDIVVDAGVNNMYEKSTATRLTDRDMNNTLAASWIDEYGRVSEQRYLSVAGQATSTSPEVTFALKGSKQGDAHVMSGKYDVQIVLVPRWYETSEAERDTTAAVLKNRLVCTLYYWDETLAAKADPKANPGAKLDLKYTKQIKLESENIEYSGEKVDTITVLTDVKFPVSYKNLIETYPVLNIKCVKLSNDNIKNGYSRAFNIDRIILKSKD